VQCWHDRDAYTYDSIPSALMPGTLFQGAHKSIPTGTEFTFTSSDSRPMIINVFYTLESDRHGGWDTALPADGWINSGVGPSWMYQGNPQPMQIDVPYEN
jgi:hypothetical protein